MTYDICTVEWESLEGVKPVNENETTDAHLVER